jgi:hypothetical protein
LAFATSGGHEAVCASTVAVANVAIATALMKAAYDLFIMSLPLFRGCGGGATPIGRCRSSFLYDPGALEAGSETIAFL